MFTIFKKTVENGPLLSIIIPLYNHEHFIKEAIDSIINQSYQSFELIIIDDGSSDRSLSIAESYHDSRITVLAQKNMGAHNAINRGLSIAKGEYLAILNSDDVYEKDRFKVMIDYMEKHSDVSFLCSYITVINDHGKKLGIKEGWKNMEPWSVPNPNNTLAETDCFKQRLIINNFTATTSNFLFRRSLYEKIGGMRNLRFAHDWDFALRAAEVAECRILEVPLLRYRIHESNTISSNRKWMLFEIAWIWASNLHRFFGSDVLLGNDSVQQVTNLADSINLQGNDKLFWMLLMYFNIQQAKGVINPEEELLNNVELREHFFDYISE